MNNGNKAKRVSRTNLRAKKKTLEKRMIMTAAVFCVLMIVCALIQTLPLKFFSSTVQLAFTLVCAIGFIYGGKCGAVAGILAGFLIDCIGSADFSLSPILYMFCGYLCGILTDWFLSRNFPSFMVYMAIMGALHEGVTLFYYILFSQDFSLWNVFLNILLPEFFAMIVISPVTYGITKLVRRWV